MEVLPALLAVYLAAMFRSRDLLRGNTFPWHNSITSGLPAVLYL